jgi:hypothetical protein
VLDFFAHFDRSRYLASVRRHFARFLEGSDLNRDREERELANYTRWRFLTHFDRIPRSSAFSGRMRRQLGQIAQLPRADDIPIFSAFLMMFRETGAAAYEGRILDTWGEGGLDSLHREQVDYRRRGVLPEGVRFPEGRLHGRISPETGGLIGSAQVGRDEALLAYAGRTGFAYQRFRELALERGFTEADLDGLDRLTLNYWLGLTNAAAGGRWADLRRRPGSGTRGYGAAALLDYFRENGMGLGEVTSLLSARRAGRRMGARHPHFRNRRTMMAIYFGVNVAALEDEFAIWRRARAEAPSRGADVAAPATP